MNLKMPILTLLNYSAVINVPVAINMTAHPDLKYKKGGPVNVAGCKDFDSKKYGLSALLMLGVENLFKCSGICRDPKPAGVNIPRLYYFSDINKTQVGRLRISSARLIFGNSLRTR